MAILDTLESAIRPVVASAVSLANPPSGSYNFFTSMTGITQNFTSQISRGNILLPCVVLEIGDFMPDTDFGIANLTSKRMPITIHYIAELGGTDGGQSGVMDQAFNIGLAFDINPTWTYWEIIEPCTVLSNVDAAINAPLAGASRKSLVSASASWNPGWQVNFVTS